MSPSERVLLILCATAILYGLFQTFVQAATCRYCGKRSGHEEHCPYNMM